MTKQNKIIRKLLDPISIPCILLGTNFIISLVLFLVQPIYSFENSLGGTITFYYWNGYFESWSLENNSLIESGTVGGLSVATTGIYISGTVILFVALFGLTITSLFVDFKRKELINLLAAPMLVGGTFIFVSTIIIRSNVNPSTNDYEITRLTPTNIHALISSVIVLLMLVVALTNVNHFKGKVKVERKLASKEN